MGDNMKKDVILVIVGCLVIAGIFSGCQEQQGTTSDGQFEGVALESDVVELVGASLEFYKHYDHEYEVDVVDNVEAKYRFHNIAGKDITIRVTVEFYGNYDNLLYIGGPKTIFLFEDYTEGFYSPTTNIVSYNGAKKGEVDHVKIIAEEV